MRKVYISNRVVYLFMMAIIAICFFIFISQTKDDSVITKEEISINTKVEKINRVGLKNDNDEIQYLELPAVIKTKKII